MTDLQDRRNQERFSFDRKVALSFGGLVLCLLLIVLLVAGYNYQKVIATETNEMIRTLAKVIDDSITRTSFSGKYHSRLLLSDLVKNQPKILYCVLLDRNNRVIAHSDSSLNETIMDDAHTIKASGVLSGEAVVIQDLLLKGRSVREISTRFHTGYRHELAGYIRVGISTQEAEESIRRFWMYLSIITVALLLISMTLIYFMSRHFGMPVRRMALQLKGIMDHSPLLLAIYDSDGQILESSDAFNQVLPCNGEKCGNIFDPSIASNLRTLLLRHQKTSGRPLSQPVNQEHQSILPDTCQMVVQEELSFVLNNSFHTFTVMIFPVFGTDRKQVTADSRGWQLACLMAQDITDRVKTRKDLQRERAMLRSLIDSIPDLIFYKDSQSVYLGCNQAFEKFVGKSEREIIGKDDSMLFNHSLAEFFRRMDRIMLNSGSSRRNEEWVVYPDGRRVLLDTLKTPFVNQIGDVLGLVGISRDITRLKAIEEELASERERLMVTLASIGDGVIAIDNDGKVILVNRIAELLTGWSQFEALGKPVHLIMQLRDPDTNESIENPFRRVLVSGETAELPSKTSLMARNGVSRRIADSAAPIRDTQGSIMGVVIVFRDITEQLIMEEEFLKIRKLESLGVLAGGIAHDFNNILTAILGNLDVALQFLEKDGKVFPIISDALRASERARQLTQQLLTFSKGGAPVRSITSLAPIVRESAEFVLHGSNVVCSFQIPEDLRPAHIDAGQIGQVIQNLVLNARDAMGETGGEIMITCSNVEPGQIPPMPGSRGDQHWICIRITDNGPGIPSEIIDRIFDPYYTTKAEGSGLGLAITHSIITKHDGHIKAHSDGKGASFSIFLPTPEEEKKAESPPSPSACPCRGGTILVMDDEDMVRMVAARMLRQLGYTALTASDGGEMIDLYNQCLARGEAIDALIVDLTVPGGMGGQEAAQEILKINPDALMIVASGFSGNEVMANYRDFGFSAVLSKPYSMGSLSKALLETLPQETKGEKL